jgi:hypothetical protein
VVTKHHINWNYCSKGSSNATKLPTSPQVSLIERFENELEGKIWLNQIGLATILAKAMPKLASSLDDDGQRLCV